MKLGKQVSATLNLQGQDDIDRILVVFDFFLAEPQNEKDYPVLYDEIEALGRSLR